MKIIDYNDEFSFLLPKTTTYLTCFSDLGCSGTRSRTSDWAGGRNLLLYSRPVHPGGRANCPQVGQRAGQMFLHTVEERFASSVLYSGVSVGMLLSDKCIS